MTAPDAREALISDLAERALGAVQPEIDRLRANLTTVFHQLKAAEREAEQRLGELLYWEFEYRDAMDNYKGEVAHGKQLRAELDQLRTELADTQTFRDFHQRSAAHIAGKRDLAEAAIASWDREEISGDAAVLIIKKALGTTSAPACTCRAEPVHQAGCPGVEVAQ